MFCKNCGKEIDDNAVVCPNCGVATEKMQQATAPTQKNTIAVVGFIFSFLGGLIGLICSIIGFKNSKKPEYAGDGRGLSLAGIIISSIEIGIVVLIYILIIGVGCAAGCAGAY